MPRRRKPRTSPNELTSRYRAGDFEPNRTDLDTDDVESTSLRFNARNKNAQQNKTARTTEMRAAEALDAVDPETLPIGEVTQVYSLFSEVEHASETRLCVVRKTLQSVRDTQLVVGDRVRFRLVPSNARPDDPAAPLDEGVIEEILPRKTVLTRADSFKQIVQHPIVANAEQMLIVSSLRFPNVKWGLIDRMIIAARSGGLVPILCMNKVDLLSAAESASGDDPLDYYTALGVQTLRTSAESRVGLHELRELLTGRITVLAGHSGVGKSSLIRAIQPTLDIRTAPISNFNDKGRHTTTSARRYLLDCGGTVIDTPGVKLFGLWNVTRDTLLDFFPDVAADTAPEWRRDSYERIADSLAT